jgi:polysaccharide biosynthesis/export protein
VNSVRHIFCAMAAAFIAWFLAMPAAAQTTEYRISPGETVEIGIASIPDHNLRAVVQTDGTISLPEAGSISVAGLTPAEMQALVETLLPSKLFHVRAPDGRTQTIIVAPGDITTAIVAYRPVYVMGDVLTPGEQPYRPAMTVRQAIAVSGGFSLIRSRAAQATADPVDLQRDHESLWAEYIKEYYHQERLKAELKEQADFDLNVPAGSPLPAEVVSTIARGEAESLKMTLQNDRQEGAHLEKSMKDAVDQIEILSERERAEAAAEKADEEDVARTSQLLKTGIQTNARMADARRALLLSSNQRLATLVELMRVRSQQADYERQLERNKNQKKITLLNDLRDVSVRLADLAAKLRAASMKLQSPGAGLPTAKAVQPRVTIMRRVGDEWRQLPAGNDSEVLPGDVVEAALCGSGEDSSANCSAGRFEETAGGAGSKNSALSVQSRNMTAPSYPQN